MGKSVALVGFAQSTFQHVGERDTDELWSMNMAYRIEGMPKMDRVFEIHDWDYLNSKNFEEQYKKEGEAIGYLAWLKSEKETVLVMQEERPEVPNVQPYPLEEICQEFLSTITRGGKINRYFTSTFDYMLALALYEDYERVKIYGVEQASNTEYIYQREGTAFWLGVATGRRMKIELHPESLLLRGKLYGYEAYQMMPAELAEEWQRYYLEQMYLANENVSDAEKAWLANNSEDTRKAYEDACVEFYMYDGANKIIELLLDKYVVQDAISRQTLDSLRGQQIRQRSRLTTRLNAAMGAEQQKGNGTTNSKEIQQVFADMYAQDGSVQVLSKMIKVCDMGDPELALVLGITMADEETLQ